MTKRHTTAFMSCTAAVALASMLAACGIDQGGISAQPPPSSETVVIVGPITGFGSVIVNGVTLETAAAQILADGNPVAESDLRVGQIIRAIATITGNSTRAVSIEYEENIRGPVGQVDAVAATLVVFGQTVRADERTEFDLAAGDSLADLTRGDSIEVSGLRTPSGELLATYIGAAAGNEPYALTAPITAVDLANQVLELDGLAVDYSSVNLLSVPAGIPSLMQIVEVKGSSLGPGGELIADQIQAVSAEPGLFGARDTQTADLAAATSSTVAATTFAANFVGFVTAANASSITVGDVQVTIGPATVIAGDPSELQPGRQVHVVGRVAGPGTINADRIAIN